MDVVRIRYLDQENRWQTADCTLPGLKLEIGYQIYSASLRPNGKLDVIDRDGKVYHGNLQKDLNNEAAMLAHQWVNLGPRTNNGAAKTCLVPSHCAKCNPITCNINTLSGFEQISNTFLWYTRWYTGLEWSFPRAEVKGPRASLHQATDLSTITG